MPCVRFTVFGLIATSLFQKCTECAEHLNKNYKGEYEVNVIKEMPRDMDDRKTTLLASGKLSSVRISRDELMRSNQLSEGLEAGIDTNESFLSVGSTLMVSGHHAAVRNAEVLVLMELTEPHGTTGAKQEGITEAPAAIGAGREKGSGGDARGTPQGTTAVDANEKNETIRMGKAEETVLENSLVGTTDVPIEASSVQTGECFLLYIQQVTNFRVLPMDPSHPDSYANRAIFSWKKFLHDRGNRYCWLSIKIGDRDVGKITLELFSPMLPRTSTNFWRLCSGRGGEVIPEGETEPVELTYKGTTFFRILKGAWIMGGDVSAGHTGTGGYSCYGRHFPDESFAVPHSDAGILGMCNDGEHSNASSFYITMGKMSWMNGKYVAFGRVVDGMRTVEEIHRQPVKHNQSPVMSITIADCGALDVSM